MNSIFLLIVLLRARLAFAATFTWTRLTSGNASWA